jgi:hypothetical protein
MGRMEEIPLIVLLSFPFSPSCSTLFGLNAKAGKGKERQGKARKGKERQGVERKNPPISPTPVVRLRL